MRKPIVATVLCLLLCLLSLPSARAQQTQEQLASHYYSSGEFAQAAEIYEDLYKKYPNKFYYQMLYRSYLELQQYRDAERLTEKRLRQFPAELFVYVDQGMIYEKKGEPKKAAKIFDRGIDKIGFDSKQTGDLALAFENCNHPEYALKTYLSAREKMRNKFVYVGEVATLYQRMGNYEAMMQEYFDLLDNSPGMMSSIQLSMQRVLADASSPVVADGLRSALIQRVQQHPENKYYLEMMIWFSLQQKDFRFAMEQAQAVDARFPDMGGETLMRVAGIARSNGDYDVAQECYASVARKGAENPYYFEARVGALEVQFERLDRNFPVDNDRLRQLLRDYDGTLAELGRSVNTSTLMRNYAHLLAYYADSVQAAADCLYDILELPKLPAKVRDEVKLDLGDLLLFAGEVWDASLLYMQVDKANHNDVLGSQAKYRNAKLSYYNHDFAWANSQLKVLRASTTKLIANDAMELSLLISDNMDDDSTYTMLESYADADLLLYRNQLDSAYDALEALSTSALSHPIFDEVLLQKARIRIRQQRYAEADSLLRQLVEFYPNEIVADDAVMLLAQLNEERLNNMEQARYYYEKLILDYPASLFVDQARKRYNLLKAKTK